MLKKVNTNDLIISTTEQNKSTVRCEQWLSLGINLFTPRLYFRKIYTFIKKIDQ